MRSSGFCRGSTASLRSRCRSSTSTPTCSASFPSYEEHAGAISALLAEIADDTSALEVVDDSERSTAVAAELEESAHQAPVVRFVTMVLADAIRKGASDIHCEPYERVFRIRFRVDGMLHEVLAPPKRQEAAILSRLKIMANLDIAERRLPQDGRIKVRHNGREIDFRVSVLPTIFGERPCCGSSTRTRSSST